MKQRWPNMRWLVIACLATWLNAVAGIVLAFTRDQWAILPWAVNAAVCAAGWFIAVMRWVTYQHAAFLLAAELDTRTSFPRTADDARECIHGTLVWFGHECGLCEVAGEYVWK